MMSLPAAARSAAFTSSSAQRSLSGTLAWARERLDTPLTVGDLAAHACQSVTTVHRRFRAELGTTPLAPPRTRRGVPVLPA